MTLRTTRLALLVVVSVGWAAGQPGAALAQTNSDGSAETASDPARELERIERALDSERATRSRLDRIAGDLAREISRLRREMAAAATRARRTEQTVTDVEASLATLREEMGEKRALLAGRRQELSRLTGALQRLARRPPEALLLIGRSPLETVRTGILLEGAIPGIHQEARRLRAELQSLTVLEGEIRTQRLRLEAAATALDDERAQLAALAEEKADVLSATRDRVAGTEGEVQALAESARSLRELLRRLERHKAAEAEERRRLSSLVAPAPAPRAPKDSAPDSGPAGDPVPQAAVLPGAVGIDRSRGQLFAPAVGALAGRFGQTDANGLTSRGLLLRTRPGALVVAPYDGSVLYAGPFEGFGRILIIEHGSGYHTLLAGLGRVDLEVGQRVLAGEPVGAMATASESGGPATGPELYVELRHNGDPIDPIPWFAGLTEKAKG